MKTKETIPIKGELAFIIKLVSVITISSLLSFVILYVFMNKQVGTSYRSAFQIILEAYNRMNFYIITAVLIQLILSSFVVYFLALHYSHRIAGPMYRLKIIIQQYLRGEDIERIAFRRTDFLQDVAEKFTDFFSFLARRNKLFEEAKELLVKVDLSEDKQKQVVLQHLKNILDELEKTNN